MKTKDYQKYKPLDYLQCFVLSHAVYLISEKSNACVGDDLLIP